MVYTLKCDGTPIDICYAYSMKRIYVAFGNFVVQYEIKKTLCTQCVETKRIQVQITVLGSDFSINSDLPYVKFGDRPLICSSSCGKKGSIYHKM